MKRSENSDTAKGGIRVLVVDDSTVVRELMNLTLSRMGVDLEIADNGEDALALIGQKHFDVVFLDIMLPGIDGYRVCKEIKADRRNRDIVVIMLTSKDTVFDRVRGSMAGTDAYLTKPLDRNALLTAMRECLPQWRESLAEKEMV